MKLIHWDCLEEMDKLIEQWIKVDAIITDPPYWTTACKRDSVIPFDAMWERLNKLIKPNGAIVLFGSEPFSSALRMSNIKNYKYDIKWEKEKITNIFLVKKQIWKVIEDMCIFYKKQPTYNPQMYKAPEYLIDKRKTYNNSTQKDWVFWKWWMQMKRRKEDWLRYPKNIIQISRERSSLHPTQKPVALIEYLIKTYTNEWETVLDFTMWSWSCWVACKNLWREFIWIELDDKYFEIAKIIELKKI